jgi:hypothetical protein
MSRRSILLATTFYVALGSFAVVGPASAHGFGVGGFGGGHSGPALSSIRSPSSSGFSGIGRTPIQSMGNFGGSTKLDHVPSIGTPAPQGNIAPPSPALISLSLADASGSMPLTGLPGILAVTGAATIPAALSLL